MPNWLISYLSAALYSAPKSINPSESDQMEEVSHYLDESTWQNRVADKLQIWYLWLYAGNSWLVTSYWLYSL